MNKFWQYFLFFVVCVLAQVLLFDNIPLWGFVQPYPYLLFILVLPTNITRPWLYVLAFLLGLTIDLFASTLCLHAAATTFMAFLRQPLIVLTTSQRQLLKSPFPLLRTQGFLWTLRYTLLLVLAHHLLMHYLALTPVFAIPWLTLLRVVANTVVTGSVILIIEFFIYAPNESVKS